MRPRRTGAPPGRSPARIRERSCENVRADFLRPKICTAEKKGNEEKGGGDKERERVGFKMRDRETGSPKIFMEREMEREMSM